MAAIESRMHQRVALWLLAVCMPWLAGCTTTGVLLGAAGVASDTSVTWEIVKHLHAKATEGDAAPCWRIDSVQRALNPRCGAFVPGSLSAQDVRSARLPECALATVVRDARLWPVLPELLDKGAQPEACARSPLVELARQSGCPDFNAASPAVVRSMQWLAQADARAVQHDVMRMFTCPSARTAGLDAVLPQWLEQGALERGTLGFAPLGALQPDYLDTPFARALQAQGHTAGDALGSFDGVQPRGFEEALRQSHWVALDWWLAQAPELANRVPPTQGNQLPWVPLASVLVPSFLANPERQAETLEFLMARGADPWRKLPFDSNSSVVQYARTLKSPMLQVLDSPPRPQVVARTGLPPQ
jgi:hypothetical protein